MLAPGDKKPLAEYVYLKTTEEPPLHDDYVVSP
ncbi:Uncharacterised protein [Corynebacterium kutscheri]|nr:Uncharacterised protein [Corynebacterium kutscheri]